MNRLSRVAVAAALASMSAVAFSQGAGGPPSPEAQAKTAIETRQGLFKLISNQMGPIGGMLRNLIRRDSHASAISRAIALLRRDFRSPIEIPKLASSIGMSPSSFHKHFKSITAASPLQFQKELRLLEARRLLRTGATSVSAAAFDVGYESATHFSREYARKFGAPPKQDIGVG